MSLSSLEGLDRRPEAGRDRRRACRPASPCRSARPPSRRVPPARGRGRARRGAAGVGSGSRSAPRRAGLAEGGRRAGSADAPPRWPATGVRWRRTTRPRPCRSRRCRRSPRRGRAASCRRSRGPRSRGPRRGGRRARPQGTAGGEPPTDDGLAARGPAGAERRTGRADVRATPGAVAAMSAGTRSASSVRHSGAALDRGRGSRPPRDGRGRATPR